MHFVLGWTSESDGEPAARIREALLACLAETGSVEILPGLHVVQVRGHGQQERILKRLAEAAAAHPAANLRYVASPLIIGGQYQGRLFDAEAAEQVNRLADEPE